MNSLAALATVNGDLANSTYGETPNNPATWDAFRLFGCLCDEQYTGYDCSLYTCPYGDDPNTSAQVDEQQKISCSDADATGNIVLTFRQQTTGSLGPTATVAEVKSALEALSTVGQVNVETYEADAIDALCGTLDSPGNAFVVTFLTEHGDVPLIQSVTQYVDSFSIAQSVQGTKESLECSGRGLCDHSSGECVCFTGFGSSDGMGGAGALGDCGYLEPLAAEE